MKGARLFDLFRRANPESAPVPPLDLEQVSTTVRRLREEHEAACDARRRMIVGTVLLAHAQTQPELDDYLMALLDHFLEEDQDRALFGLAPREIPLVYVDPDEDMVSVPLVALLRGRVRWQKRPLPDSSGSG